MKDDAKNSPALPERTPLAQADDRELDPTLRDAAALFRQAAEDQPPALDEQKARVWLKVREGVQRESVLSLAHRLVLTRYVPIAAATAVVALAVYFLAVDETPGETKKSRPKIAEKVEQPAPKQKADTPQSLGRVALAGDISKEIKVLADKPLPLNPQQQAAFEIRGDIAGVTAANSLVKVLAAPDGGRSFKLETGQIVLNVKRYAGRPPVEVLSGRYRVVVTGTVFKVARVGESTTVSVRRGQVKVFAADAKNPVAEISAGQCATLSAGEPAKNCSAESSSFDDVPEALFNYFADADSSNKSSVGFETLLAAFKPANAEKAAPFPTAEAPVKKASPKVAAIQPSASSVEKKAAPPAKGAEKRKSAPAETSAAKTQTGDDWDELSKILPGKPAETKIAMLLDYLGKKESEKSVGALMQLGDAYKEAGQYNEAVTVFKRLSRRETSGLLRENAWYEIGYISFYRLGKTGDAIEAWQSYLAAFPNGVFRVEIDFHLAQALIKSGRKNEALNKLKRFLAEHPRSDRSGDVHFLLATLYREHMRDCTSAIKHYQKMLALSPRSSRREDAHFFQAACLDAENRSAAAIDGYREYLKRYPSGKFVYQAQSALQRLGR